MYLIESAQPVLVEFLVYHSELESEICDMRLCNYNGNHRPLATLLFYSRKITEITVVEVNFKGYIHVIISYINILSLGSIFQQRFLLCSNVPTMRL